MLADVPILKQMSGIQYYGAGDDKYWIGYIDADKFEDWFEGYGHQSMIVFRTKYPDNMAAKDDCKKGSARVRELWIKSWIETQGKYEVSCTV